MWQQGKRPPAQRACREAAIFPPAFHKELTEGGCSIANKPYDDRITAEPLVQSAVVLNAAVKVVLVDLRRDGRRVTGAGCHHRDKPERVRKARERLFNRLRA